MLRDRLGVGATAALLELVDRAIDERKPGMITAATERFERRMVEEIAAVRVLVAETEGRLRESIAQTEARGRESLAQTELRMRDAIAQTEVSLHDAMRKSEGRLREEIALIRVDMGKMENGLRQEIAAGRVELFKWSFVFWIGQVLALAGFFAVMIRVAR